MTKTLQEIRNQMKSLVKEDTNLSEDNLYIVKCYEELTQYTNTIGYYKSFEEAQKAAQEDLAANNNREDVLSYTIDVYTYKNSINL